MPKNFSLFPKEGFFLIELIFIITSPTDKKFLIEYLNNHIKRLSF